MARLLNIGCGLQKPDGWTNADLPDADLTARLPWADATFDGAVCHHVLDMLTPPQARHALGELRRVLKPDAVLRVSVPDIIAGFEAFQVMDGDWFPNDGLTHDERFCAWLMWHGTRRSAFTPWLLMNMCEDAGFDRAGLGWTGFAGPELRALDTRQDESLFVDAVR